MLSGRVEYDDMLNDPAVALIGGVELWKCKSLMDVQRTRKVMIQRSAVVS